MGGFGLLSLFYIFIGARFLIGFLPRWRDIFSPPLTPEKRQQLSQAAFFILIPVSVALHELGHAVAVVAYGREVLDFGFYFFAGFVSYDPTGLNDFQQMVIAFAGTAVNLVLVWASLAVVYLKRPPQSPAMNELLLQFAIISGLNALIFYPLIDLATGMSGDWSQMYNGGVPWFTALIVALQAWTIGVLVWLSRNRRARQRLGHATGFGPVERPVFHRAGTRPDGASMPANLAETSSVAQEVAKGWPERVRVEAIPGMAPLQQDIAWVTTLLWNSGAKDRQLAIVHRTNGATALFGNTIDALGMPDKNRQLNTWRGYPTPEELGLSLRTGMEMVDTW